MSNKATEYAKQIKSPSTITAFIKDARLMADDMEAMLGKTDESDQALAAANILEKYGCL